MGITWKPTPAEYLRKGDKFRDGDDHGTSRAVYTVTECPKLCADNNILLHVGWYGQDGRHYRNYRWPIPPNRTVSIKTECDDLSEAATIRDLQYALADAREDRDTLRRVLKGSVETLNALVESIERYIDPEPTITGAGYLTTDH